MNGVGPFQVLWRAQKGHWYDAIVWSLCNIGGGLFPFWATLLVLLLMSQALDIGVLFGGGQLAIYSAGLLAPAMYMLFREDKEPFAGRRVFVIVAIAGILASGILFAVATAFNSGAAPSARRPLNVTFLVGSTGVVYGISALLTFWVALIDIFRTKIMVDPEAAEQEQQEELEEEFDRTEEDDTGSQE